MRRAALVLSLSALLAPAACGGKDKGAAEPGAGGNGSAGAGGTVQDPENIDPEGGLGAPGAPGDPGSEAGAGPEGGSEGAGGEEGGGDAGGEEAEKAPPIKPPGLDLTPAEKSARVKKHVGRARQALSGQSKDPDLAIHEARAALKVDETSTEAMILLAHANYEKGYLDLAEDILDKAKERGDGAEKRELHFLLGLIYERTERKDQATAAYERAVALDPNYRSALLNLGVRYLDNNRYEQAIELYERLTGQLGENSAKAWNNLAAAYRGRSADFAATDMNRRNELLLKAETTYKRAIAVERDYGPSYYNLGLLYLDADPFPTPKGDMDRLRRLKRAKTYFDEYRGKPAADGELADKQTELAQTLYDEEKRKREKLEEAKRRQKEMEEKMKKLEESSGDDDSGGWE